MEIVYAAVGALVGAIIGYFLGSGPSKSEKERLEEELSQARDELGAVKRQSLGAVDKEKARAGETLEKLAALQEQAGQLRQELDAARNETEQVRARTAEVEKAHTKALEAAEAHKMARQQAEGRHRQAEQVANDARSQIKDMGAQLEKAQATARKLTETNDRQNKELQRLRADASSARSSSSGLDESVEAFSSGDGSLEGVLTVLLEREGQSSAVVADSNGIIVAATGEEDLKESMAASAQVIRTAVRQLDGVVPFTTLRAFMLQDSGANVISGRFFNCAGEDVGLATYGPRIPSERVLDGAMANVSSILE